MSATIVAPLFDVTVTRSGRKEHVLRLEPENNTRRLETDSNKAVQAHAQGERVGSNPGELVAALLRLGDNESEPEERGKRQPSELDLWAAFVRENGGNPEEILRGWAQKKTESGAKAGSLIPDLLEKQQDWRRVPTKKRTAAQETLRRKLNRARAALAQIGYIHDPEKKPSLIDTLNEGSWSGFRCGPNVVLLPYLSTADDKRHEAVVRFLADREAEGRVRPEADVPAKREAEPGDDELHFFASLLRMNGRDPEETLRREMEKITKRSRKAGPRLAPLLEALDEAERERRLAGKSLGGPKYERRRKKFRRTRDALVPGGYARDPEKKLPIWAALEKAEREVAAARVGQENLSQENDSTKSAASRTPVVNSGDERREGDATRGKTNLDRRRRRAGTAPAANAPKSAKQRRRPRLHQARPEPRGVPGGRPRTMDRVPTPPLNRRPRPRRPGRVKKKPPP
jgi:hypothetical protein